MSVAREVAPDRAIEALSWAADVARDPELLDQKPERPTPAEWRAIPQPMFREHMDRLLTSKNPEPGLDAIESVGCLDAWLPEVAVMVGFGDNEWRHKDVWLHTKQVVKQSVPRIEVRWGALLHDIGKPKTRRIDDDGTVTFHGHAEVGASMFRKRVADRVGFEGAERERVHFLILHHLRAAQYDEDWTDAAVRRFYNQMSNGLRDLLDLSRADITTKRPEKRRRGVRQISLLARRIRDLQEEDEKVAPLPKGLGTLIMEKFGIPPSRRLGDLIKQLTTAAEAGELEPQKPAEYYIEYLLTHREEYALDD
ncbi:MAG: HDIG domain-containing protein [Deltaproteobacteria bacterium]|nr:HDIG domain-containing protein [Deltaproteobacteria bacterium]